MAEKKYKVAKDVALTAKGVIYKPGDELPEDILTKEQQETLLKAKKIVEATAEEKKADDEAKADSDDKKADEGKASDSGKDGKGGKK